MKVGILGTGTVAQTIGAALAQKGHEVVLGSRSAGNASGNTWAEAQGGRARCGTFADAAAFGEIVFNCTLGAASVDVVQQVAASLAGKVLVDVSNPLDFSGGFPPRLTVCNDDSLGEQIQRAVPAARVVKALNMVANPVMVDPSRVPGEHDLLICGDDADAKASVASLLREQFGWSSILDIGGIAQARALEMYLPLWVRLYGALGTGDFNIRIVRAKA